MDTNVKILIAEESTTEQELLCKINELNENKNVHGILVQLPLPKHLDEDAVMEDVFECGGDDFDITEETAEIEGAPEALAELREGLTAKGYNVLSAETDRIPANYTALTDEEHIKKMNLLLEHLEDNDDVQNVYHNWEMPEEE